MQNNTQYIQEDKIDLRELFSILKKRKKLIWSMTALFTLLALVYVFIAKPVYEVKSNIQIGFIGEKSKNTIVNKLLDDSSTIIETLNVVFDVEGEIKSKESFISKVSSISQNKNLGNFITVKTEAITNDEALTKNKEVLTYLQTLYQSKIDLYIAQQKDNIEETKQSINDIEDLEVKNLQEELKKLKTQDIVKIDDKIKILKEQTIPKLKQKITIIKTQTITKLDNKIIFLNDYKLKTIETKINFQSEKLHEYTEAIEKLYKEIKSSKDSTVKTISSIQMVNYQNLILNAKNKIEDLKIAQQLIIDESIPNLIREKKNLNDVAIRDLELKIDNAESITLLNLQKEKTALLNDTIRKLQYKIDIILPTKKSRLEQKIKSLKYNISEQNLQNSKVIGKYIIKDDPIKPKKKLIIIVAFITGLMLSIFLTFSLEFIRNTKKKKVEE